MMLRQHCCCCCCYSSLVLHALYSLLLLLLRRRCCSIHCRVRLVMQYEQRNAVQRNDHGHCEQSKHHHRANSCGKGGSLQSHAKGRGKSERRAEGNSGTATAMHCRWFARCLTMAFRLFALLRVCFPCAQVPSNRMTAIVFRAFFS